MMYYTDEARVSAIDNIRKLKSKINDIPSEHLDYISASQITQYLTMLEKEIDKERKPWER